MCCRRCRYSMRVLMLFIGFLTLWALLTLVFLTVQDYLIGPILTSSEHHNKAKRSGALQVVVGHYNGNLPKEKRDNLTDEQVNANEYLPQEGWGEGGSPVRLNFKEEVQAENTFGLNQFNLYVSDRISINRSLPDIRKQACRQKTYPSVSTLPHTSVIIVYHNEAYSTLLRTVSSVINRSPKQLLKEIILVDDFSNRTFLREPLNNFARSATVKVKIIRTKSRVGLIRARMMGAQEADGDVLTFLDSHCECTQGWLEPLLSRIKENRKIAVCPVIDVINDRTFQYQKGIELFRGGFNWNLQFRWYALPQEKIQERASDPTKPIESPTMAGGLFSIDRKYFEEVGEYDAGMDIWGGENLEMSFRIWQCGGRVEILPCSHVGHIFRKASPHDFPGKSSGKILNTNLMRVAEVWLDEWKYLFYKTTPQAGALRSILDVSQRIELRKKLRCKSFSWYLNNVFTDHFLPQPGEFFGRIASPDARCILSRPADRPGTKLHKLSTADCTLGFDVWQFWIFTRDRRLRADEHLCLSAARSTHLSTEWHVQLKECGGYKSEYWSIQGKPNETLQIRNDESDLCLTVPAESEFDTLENRLDGISPPIITPCDKWKNGQKWKFSEVSWRPTNDNA